MPLPNVSKAPSKKLTREEIEEKLAALRAKKVREKTTGVDTEITKDYSESSEKSKTQAHSEEDDSEYEIDEETGIKYKKLAPTDPEAIKAYQKGGGKNWTVDQLMKYANVDEDFDLDDLNSSAQIFLPHLRIAPSKEELELLRQERIDRVKNKKKNQTQTS